jgi:hypothetical protein
MRKKKKRLRAEAAQHEAAREQSQGHLEAAVAFGRSATARLVKAKRGVRA